MEYNKFLVLLFMICMLVIVFGVWYLIIKNIVLFFKNSKEKHIKEMEVLQAQLDYYNNNSNNGT